MFSKKMVVIVATVILIIVNIIILSLFSSSRHSCFIPGKIAVFLVAPFQNATAGSIKAVKDIWHHYFYLVSVSIENDKLKKILSNELNKNNLYIETDLSNKRLRKILNFSKTISFECFAAEVVGRDPSPWFKTITIDKGKAEGVEKGFPVVSSEGIVGQVIDVASHYSKVLLMIDRNSAVDAVVQRTRARGLIKGRSSEQCFFQYVLRKNDIIKGDSVISSGLDGVFPKGLRIGSVTDVVKKNFGIFQEITVMPCVDFEKLEEVLVLIKLQKQLEPDYSSEPS